MLIVPDESTFARSKKLPLLLIIILLSVNFFPGCLDDDDDDENHENGMEKITLGALLPLTGSRASRGIAEYEALNISLADIQEFITSAVPEDRADDAFEIELQVEDTETDPDVALEKLKSLNEQGIKVVIGPHSSDETAAVKEYADDNDILIISVGSTSPDLAIPNDNIFRVVPDATHEGHALATLITDDGIEVIVPILRDDLWANGLFNATKQDFIDLGGEVTNEIKYDTSTTEFSSTVTSLETTVNETLGAHEGSSIAVVVFSFDEVVSLFEQVKDSIVLDTIRWYGGTGVSKVPGIVADPDLAAFARKTELYCSSYGLDENAKTKRGIVADRIAANPEAEANVYAFATYDALWLAVLSYLDILNADTEGSEVPVETLKTVLPTVAENYFGITGWTLLNEEGDRKFGNYDFWAVEGTDIGGDNEENSWEVFARYVPGPDLEGQVVREKDHMKPYEGKKILFINSYHEGYEWSDGISAGINESFGATGVELRSFCMDTKRNPEEDFKNQSAHDAKTVIDFFDPDVVITSDDNAFKYLVMPYYRNATLPFAFCGINWDLSAYEGAPYTNTAGILEVVPIESLVDTLKEYGNGTRIGYLAIDRLTMHKDVDHYETLFNITEKSFANNFSAWKDSFMEMQQNVDVLLLGNIVGMDDWNDTEAETFVHDNIGIPVGTPYDWMMPYSMLGFTSVAGEQGEVASRIAMEILDGISPSDIPLVHNEEEKIFVNPGIADDLGITLESNLLDKAIIV